MNAKTSIRCQNFREYLSQMNALTLDKLYAESAICLAVFRELPPLAKHYTSRLLFVEQPIPTAVINSWVTQSALKEHNETIEMLKSLRIWSDAQVPGGLPAFLVNSTFRNSLKVALLGGGDPWIIKQTKDKDKHERDITFLDNYALERWECILHFMVGSQNTGEGISADTIQTLVKAGLTRYETKDTSPSLTAEGFQFLLMDTFSQVWYFVIQYLANLEAKGLNLVECLSFLFQLSFLTLGKSYSTEGMNDSLLAFLQNLRELGLIYQRKRKDGRFYPTRLIINLTKGHKEPLNVSKQGYIVVETNYRVYAYTDSPLQIALLALFTEMQYRFPKFCLGILTRDSVRQAFRSGITADQITNFLKQHAHPSMSNTPTILPPTVIDQIRLWELERDRFLFHEGILYSQFLSQNDFEILKTYASDAGHLIWDNPAKRVMVVSPSGHDDVRRFWKRHKKEH
ncbi:General transcription factor IIH subunit 4-like protein [Dinothrombium tinctorium]|uniref:General transcription factor IIH subunit 4 n=1 Tax=Dinothrombium tinctorium TaxID=1965070 RepID=A0A3S3PQF5_9ACAR|nr:General transcription factor IIH subunit 4-like protein [Dinothrombium tinctorium]